VAGLGQSVRPQGMISKRVIEIVPSDSGWPSRFEAEARRLHAAIPGAVSIDHVGSTAVPGLPAKPTIDIQISVLDLMDRSV
jgi:GrpB-like predicted nucleotidyltransferase (UPF0157 family)